MYEPAYEHKCCKIQISFNEEYENRHIKFINGEIDWANVWEVGDNYLESLKILPKYIEICKEKYTNYYVSHHLKDGRELRIYPRFEGGPRTLNG